MVTKPKQASSGPPQWTYVIGAIVTVGGLVWGMVSYFIPKPEPVKTTALPAPAPTPSVNVSGTSNIGVGQMSGGQIIGGGVAPQASTPTR